MTRNALLDGRRAALLTALGINLGVLFWVTAAALGLAAVVAASAPAFAAIKLAGASYALLAARGRIVLIGLGARLALERRS